MKILVCGSGGFIGRHLTQIPSLHNVEIYEYRNLFSASEAIKRYEPSEAMLIRLREFLLEQKPITVINCAWVATPCNYRESSLNLYFYNFSKSLFDVCLDAGVSHFIGIGSSAEYGPNPQQCLESDDLSTGYDEYSKNKIAFLRYLKSNSGNTSTRVSWIRPFQPYGEFQDRAKFIQKLNESFLQHQPFVIENANVFLDWIHVRDIADAVRFVYNNELEGIFNVGTGIGTSNLELYRLFAKHIHPYSRSSIFINSGDYISIVASKSSSLFKLGWTPNYDLLQGLREVFG